MLELASHISWHYRKYGVQAFVAMGKKGDAIKYAKASCGLNDSQIAIDLACSLRTCFAPGSMPGKRQNMIPKKLSKIFSDGWTMTTMDFAIILKERWLKRWHHKALGKAQNVSLSGFIEICRKTKEWDKLAEHISSIDTQLLEELSHYTTQRAAKGLAKKHNLAAAIIYSALGMRIIKKGKSKYYHYALEHFRKACKLYEKSGRNQLWIDLVERVRKDHSRKYSFIGDFEEIVDRRPQKRPESFETRALKRWKKQTS